MKSTEEAIQQLFTRAIKLQNMVKEKLADSSQQKRLADLIIDLENNEHIITVLGEFKRGKSTLMNALIHQQLLPSDVTPTTATINIIKHADFSSLKVYLENGDVLEKQLVKEELQKMTFSNGSDFTHINHVEISMPFSQFGENVVLVDTPGVGDLNEHRIDVTYSYIPRSSVVIFVIDCTTPLRRSELDYLKNHVVPNLFGELIIVANFYDRIDEEEWEEEIEEYIQKKLNKALGNVPYTLFALSAKDAVNDEDEGQFEDFEKEIHQVIQNGQANKEKIKSYERRLSTIIESVTVEIEILQGLRNASEEEIIKAQAELEAFKKQAQLHEQTIEQYISKRKEEIIAMLRKSVNTFDSRLSDLILQEIEDYPGGKFKNFLEVQIPKRIQQEANAWISHYSRNVDTLIKKVELRAYEGVEQLIQQNIQLLQNEQSTSNSLTEIGRVKLTGKDDSATVMSGAFAGLGATAIFALGAGPLFPLVALAGYPVLNKFIGEKKLQNAKEEAMPVAEVAVHEITKTLYDRLAKHIDIELYRVQMDVKREFNHYITKYESELAYELQSKQQKLSVAPVLTLGELEAVR